MGCCVPSGTACVIRIMLLSRSLKQRLQGSFSSLTLGMVTCSDLTSSGGDGQEGLWGRDGFSVPDLPIYVNTVY